MLRWYDQLWNHSDETIVDELMHPQCRAFGLGPDAVIGPEAFKQFYRQFISAYSDIAITVDKNLTDGDYVVSLCSVTGKHTESGRLVSFTGTSLCQVENGKITSAWNHFDFLTMYLQTGQVKAEDLV